MSLRPWQLSLVALSLCAIALFATLRYRNLQVKGHEWLFRRLPTDHAMIVGIDVGALRKAGLLDLLAGSRVEEELDYRRFVDQTAFDYRTDLDYVAASVSDTNDANFFVLQGRFDWQSLFRTAKQVGGRCLNAFCDLPGYSSGRNLSFLPIAPQALGLSVSRVGQAAWALAQESTGVPMPRVPQYQAFVAMDASVLAASSTVPPAIRGLTDVLSSADFVVLGIAANSDGRLELALDADCMSPASAAEVTSKIEALVGKTDSLFAPVRNGSVRTDGQSVHARWPVDRAMLEALVSH